MKILLILLLALLITGSTYSFKNNPENKERKIRGICYFDIDNTLTHVNQTEKNKIIQECLDNDFDVGIITASKRRLFHICNGNKSKESWMSDLLCERLNQEPRLFNSYNTMAGTRFITNSEKYGHIKGHQMTYGRDLLYPDIPDKCIVLFDDDKDYLKNIKLYNSNLETQCSNRSCGLNSNLTLDVVRNKINEMKKNGC